MGSGIGVRLAGEGGQDLLGCVAVPGVAGEVPEHGCNFGERAVGRRGRPVDGHSSVERSVHRTVRAEEEGAAGRIAELPGTMVDPA